MKTMAEWITSPVDSKQAAYTFRKSFCPQKSVKKATLCVSAMGLYALYINGSRFGKGVLTPGWTSYKHRVQYQTYDITACIVEDTVIECSVGQGWAVGHIGIDNENHYFADHTSLIAWLEVEYTDGTDERVVTDESWEVYTSSVVFSEIYHGETVDMTAPITRVGKAVLSDVHTELVPQVGEWITEQERLAPVALIRTPKGETVLDFGQNMTGYVEVRIQAPRGSRVVLHHAEVLDKDGNFYTANLRTARNETVYVCSGGEDVCKPTYCFQGFRYIQLVEYPFDTVDMDSFRAIVVHSDMQRTGSFVCGNEKINQLYHNILWGQKSNYLDVPTDCPQRDERLGWTGDAQVFCRTAAIQFDVERFFKKWLGDMALEQKASGAVRGVVPAVSAIRQDRISAAWGDASCIIPWELYTAYGDKAILEQSFPMMQKWVEYMRAAGPEEYLWLGGIHYGDWLAMDAGGDSYVGATANDLIASAFFAYSTSLLVKAGEALGKDMSEYRSLYEQIRDAFCGYFMENGMPKAELPFTEPPRENYGVVDTVRKGVTQTALVLILHFGLCEEEERGALSAKLVELIRENGGLMSTGFVGTPYLLHVLSDNGYTDVAYELLFQEKSPSWLYSVNHGATTMWEHWNSIKEDGSFWSTDMNSFNHYAYGAVFDWIFGVMCGIKPTETAPGYKEVRIAPHPNKRIGFVDTAIETRHGRVAVHWYYKEDTVYYEFTVPQGVTAHITLPSGYTATVGGGIHHFAE